jgi:hypothetical protein
MTHAINFYFITPGDSVFAWPLVKNLYREKLINVITEFYNEQPTKGEK